MKGDTTDPKYVGPGTWYVIHRLAFLANDTKSQKIFIKTMSDICDGFPCTVCRGHCKEYISNNPMENFLDKKMMVDGSLKNLGMFMWTWNFHNAVNIRIGKRVVNWDTAYNLYANDDSLICSQACLEAEDDTKKTTGTKQTKKIKLYTKV